MFTLGYEKTGLGPRIALGLVKLMGRRTLFLGYAIMLTDLILSPFTPSTTARSGGTIYPIVRNIPMLYDSKPNDPSYRRIGNYIMWITLVATCGTSSMFVTALSSNLLAVSFVKSTGNIELTWVQWFIGHLPVTILMLLFLPLLVYWLNPPEVKQGQEVPKWAGEQLAKLGPLSAREIMFGAMVCAALVLWIAATNYINTTTVALVVIALMLMTRIVTWTDMLGNSSAWNVLVWFATLIPMADGLARVGFVKWFAESIAGHIMGFSPTATMIVLVLVFFFSHYMFASVTAHVTALVPVLVTVAMAVPGMNMVHFSLLMCYALGTMGVITPYATGPSPLIAGSGYVPGADYWRLGAITGIVILAVQLAILVPWLRLIG
jgi:L-tartrate/succinate antiporter